MTDKWQGSTQYYPGDLVRPKTVPDTDTPTLANPDFDDGNSGWDTSGGDGFIKNAPNRSYSGDWCLRVTGDGGHTIEAINNAAVPVTSGKTCTISAMARYYGDGETLYWAAIFVWLDDDDNEVDRTTTSNQKIKNHWMKYSAGETPPDGATKLKVGVYGLVNPGNEATNISIDNVRVDTGYVKPPFSLLYQAVQNEAGYSGSDEPDWPTSVGQTVTDNEVTWKAVYPNRVTWKAEPLLVSGASEPDWPGAPGATVADGTINWTAHTQRVEDVNCPNTKVVCIAASKVYAVSERGDTVAFSKTVDPLDWTGYDDAGYIPFGMQKFGANPVKALNLYRSNLVCFNAEGFQMWQVDADPANIALLDALPVGTTKQRSMSPVMNDLFFLSPMGVRSLAVSAASNSMQAAGVGEPIDALVLDEDVEPTDAIHDVGRGQYLIAFSKEDSAQVFVFTTSSKAWSRYTFPFPVDYFCQVGDSIEFRSGDNIMAFDEVASDDAGEAIEGVVWWPWLGLGADGVTKMLQGTDMVATQEAALAIGQNENDQTEMMEVGTLPADTVPGFIVPLQFMAPSYSARLTFDTWPWRVLGLQLYYNDQRPGS